MIIKGAAEVRVIVLVIVMAIIMMIIVIARSQCFGGFGLRGSIAEAEPQMVSFLCDGLDRQAYRHKHNHFRRVPYRLSSRPKYFKRLGLRAQGVSSRRDLSS